MAEKTTRKATLTFIVLKVLDSWVITNMILKFFIVLSFRMMNLGKILNDLGQVVAMSAPPLLSAVWFPSHQRTTITSIATSPGSIGVAIGYIAGN